MENMLESVLPSSEKKFSQREGTDDADDTLKLSGNDRPTIFTTTKMEEQGDLLQKELPRLPADLSDKLLFGIYNDNQSPVLATIMDDVNVQLMAYYTLLLNLYFVLSGVARFVDHHQKDDYTIDAVVCKVDTARTASWVWQLAKYTGLITETHDVHLSTDAMWKALFEATSVNDPALLSCQKRLKLSVLQSLFEKAVDAMTMVDLRAVMMMMEEDLGGTHAQPDIMSCIHSLIHPHVATKQEDSTTSRLDGIKGEEMEPQVTPCIDSPSHACPQSASASHRRPKSVTSAKRQALATIRENGADSRRISLQLPKAKRKWTNSVITQHRTPIAPLHGPTQTSKDDHPTKHIPLDAFQQGEHKRAVIAAIPVEPSVFEETALRYDTNCDFCPRLANHCVRLEGDVQKFKLHAKCNHHMFIAAEADTWDVVAKLEEAEEKNARQQRHVKASACITASIIFFLAVALCSVYNSCKTDDMSTILHPNAGPGSITSLSSVVGGDSNVHTSQAAKAFDAVAIHDTATRSKHIYIDSGNTSVDSCPYFPFGMDIDLDKSILCEHGAIHPVSANNGGSNHGGPGKIWNFALTCGFEKGLPIDEQDGFDLWLLAQGPRRVEFDKTPSYCCTREFKAHPSESRNGSFNSVHSRMVGHPKNSSLTVDSVDSLTEVLDAFTSRALSSTATASLSTDKPSHLQESATATSSTGEPIHLQESIYRWLLRDILPWLLVLAFVLVYMRQRRENDRLVKTIQQRTDEVIMTRVYFNSVCQNGQP